MLKYSLILIKGFMNSLKKIILIVGAPGSGKTTLGEKLVKEDPSQILFLDDISVNVRKDPVEYIESILNDTKINTLIISDVNFCYSNVRDNAMRMLKKAFDVDFSVLYFENNLQKCLANIEHRLTNGDDRKVIELTKELSKIYIVPVDEIAMTIFEASKPSFKI